MASDGTLTMTQLSGNSTKGKEYILKGVDTTYSLVIEASKTKVGARYYKKETGTNNASGFGFLIMDPDTFAIETSQEFTQAVSSPVLNATFSGDGKFAFSYGNKINQTSKTIILDSNYEFEVGFESVFGTNAFLVPATIVFTPGGSTTLNFLGSYGVNNSGTQNDSLDGAIQVVDLETCGDGFKEYKPTITKNTSLSTEEVVTTSVYFSKAASVDVVITQESADIFSGAVVALTEGKAKVSSSQYCPAPATTSPKPKPKGDSAESFVIGLSALFASIFVLF
eukprot:CAMPEP_0115018436 /NCGR_PEP_ID=MMETSP0216-20121206/28797_1 /TAXON_ID=223996 /ORGANISM="Protocruzia adherens, Strain Boccale" /LENGTH=280 /DNA_ID=CAMNT_0002389615 /DNA_START=93 /DNA_END=935 /DNA_ORIENTATION=+